MELYPAIDIRGGGAVRLAQGDFDRQSDYGDPVALARRFAAAGAPWLHVVDLDAARAGRPANRATVLAIAAAVDIPVQSGGGVRSEADVDELLSGGVARVVLGTAALDDPQLVQAMAGRHPGRVAVGIDYRQDAGGVTEVAVRGWEQGSGRTVEDVLAGLADAGVAAVIVTAIERDGMLNGPDLEGLRAVLAMTEIPVIASGGVGAASDVEALARLEVASGPSRAGNGSGAQRLSGVITGRALVDGRMSVEEGVAVCARSG
ncbi:MAG TPA: 1-(5-phosphoribosyl)-5-[(5-phosphoribosylamino)methylideneamino] imidazole-4-carboxamide isomerase [Acidimicrobiales bacterium]|nr:1-(5-phosphoribosyl)-5-[(5-phosphoribosylamino)methylideneamino] imidazole-4-carboxamide isomerase [Acidimicrobiales bacterium]